MILVISVLTALLPPSTACGAASCLRWFETQPRYHAVQAFDRPAYDHMQARVRGLGGRERDCAGVVDADLAPSFEETVAKALRRAPDEVVIAYLQAKLGLARAFGATDAKACVAALMNQPDRTGAYLSGAVAKLSPTARHSFERSQIRVLQSAKAPGTRTPPYTAEAAHAHAAAIPEARRFAKAVDPNAPVEDQCRADIDLYGTLLAMPDPGRIRELRYMNDL